MFENVGQKIKKAAKVFFWLGIVGNAVLAWVAGDIWWLDLLPCILIFIALVAISYVETLVIYGFGEMVENSTNLYNLDEWYAEQEKRTKEIKETLEQIRDK